MNDQSERANIALGNRVKIKRSELEMDRGQFAEFADVSVQSIMSVEHGDFDCAHEDHLKTLQVLSLSLRKATLPPTKKLRWKRFKLH